MINRLNLTQPNEVELILMKNIREELAVIPTEFIQQITFDSTQYLKMDLEIPSQLPHFNQMMDYPLFHQIKGKQQLILIINNQKHKLVIDDKITVIETANGKKKKVSAFGYEKTLEKKTFLTGTSITRQLYRTPDETVEMTDGILNLFEQQTNWKVGYVDELARKEWVKQVEQQATMLHTSFKKEKIKLDDFFWGRHLKQPLEKGQSFTVHQRGVVVIKGDLKRDPQTFIHQFTANDKIVAIRTYASSDVKEYRYGLTYQFEYENGSKESFQMPFTFVEELDVEIEAIELVVDTGNVLDVFATRYRYFEQTSTHFYPFLMKEVSEAFDCVFEFDTFNQVLNCYHKDNYGQDHGLMMSFENGIKEINKTHQIGDIVTRLYVESPHANISEENKLGTTYVECFDYYKREGLMSDELIQALSRYDELLDKKQLEWSELRKEKSLLNQQLLDAQTELTKAQDRFKVENAILSAYIKEESNASKDEQKKQALLVSQIEQEIKDLIKKIEGEDGLQDQVDHYQKKMNEIGSAIQREQATDSQGKIFTELDLKELQEYLVEGALQDDYYLTSYGLYQHALEEIQKMNDVQIDFTISCDNLLRRLSHPDGWQALIGLGERIYLDDLEISGEQEFIQLSGFTFRPNQFELSQLKFTNNKEPKNALKTIGDIARQTSQTTTMSNHWKNVWKNAQSNNVVVENLLKEGLDAAAMEIRASNSNNQIHISEAGIFVKNAENPQQQLAILSSVIAFTEDGWSTSKLALSANGIEAESLIGNLILSEKMIVGNKDHTLKLNPEGLSIYDPQATQEERIFLGIRDQKAQLRLHNASDDHNLVLSEEGLYNIIPINSMDNFDKNHPLECAFFIGDNIKSIHKMNLRLKLNKFRGYTKSASSTPSSTFVSTTKGGGSMSYSSTSASNGKVELTLGTDTHTWNGHIGTTPPQISGQPFEDHTHGIMVGDWLEHSHTVSGAIDAHTHQVTIKTSDHTHDFELKDEGHTHQLEYGIYEFSQMPVVNVYLDDKLLTDGKNISSDQNFELTSHVSELKQGWHTIKVVGVETSKNPLGLGRASIDAFLGAFVSF